MSEAPLTELPWYLAKQPALTNTREITIIGAGIAGCTAAVALQRRGFKVTVVDRHPPGRLRGIGQFSGNCLPEIIATG